MNIPRTHLFVTICFMLGVLLAACGAPPAPPASQSTAATTPPATTMPAPAAVNYADLPQSSTPEGYHVLGDANAPVAMMVYSDFLCGACSFYVLDVEPVIIDEFVRPGTVRIIYRHLGQLGEGSLLAGEAAECAADQQQFWEFREVLYREQIGLFSSGGNVRGFVDQLAATQGLDPAAFAACMDAQTHRAAIDADFAAATTDGVRSRPTFDIQGVDGTSERLVGALPVAQFRASLSNAATP